MKIIGKVEFVGPIKKPTEKDIEKGMRFIVVVREEARAEINGQPLKESLLYQIKSQDAPDVKVGTVYLIDGRPWDMKQDGYFIRGLSRPAYEKYGKE